MPLQAAARSNAGIQRQPSSACKRLAVEGNVWSGVIVPQTIKSSSVGLIWACARAVRPAAAANVSVLSSGAAKRRSRIPVR